MIQAIALDDDRSALTVLDAYCLRAGGITLCHTFTQPHQARQFLQANRVDLVFTETQMSGESGIEFWQSVRRWAATKRTAPPGLIFATLHSDYAVLSYELQALDYLLKPLSFERFAHAIRKANDQLMRRTNPPLPPAPQRCFRVDHSLVNVTLTEITCIEALGNYCKLYRLEQQPLVIRSTMKALLHELPPVGFMQVHRSYIVGTNHIRALRNKQIYLANKQVPVGTHYERTVYTHFANSTYSSQP